MGYIKQLNKNVTKERKGRKIFEEIRARNFPK